MTPASLQAKPSAAPAVGPTLAISHATKAFGAVRALTDVSIDLYPGEAHAIVGENGAGKSTLVKILGGAHQPDSGTLEIDGQPVHFSGPAASSEAGIAIIYQEPTLFPDLSVAENVFIGRQPLRRGRRIDQRAMRTRVTAIFERLGVPIDPDRIARGLSIAEQQLVEIAKALAFEAKVVIMDEPTAALSAAEVQRLFAVVQTMRDAGTAVVFISHRLDEVFAMCQRVTVLRDGQLMMSRLLEGLTPEDLVRAMVGRDVEIRPHELGQTGDTVLSVNRLTREGTFVDISFEVKAGEIVALGGLVGAGRSEVARAIFGIDRYDAGSTSVSGKPLRGGSPSAAMAAGIGFVPEDRRQQGLVMDMSIEGNIALASLKRLRRAGLILRRFERPYAVEWATKMQIKYASAGDPVERLSGGNQQKVVLAKWLSRQPSLLIVDEPTRGIDIGTKSEVHRVLTSLARDGVAVLMISSELPELLTVADRILVMREGRIVAEFTNAQASEEVLVAAAMGQGAQP